MAEEKTLWTRVRGQSAKEPLLIGRRISAEWLKGEVPMLEVRFGGELFKALSDLLSLAKAERKNLPIIALRTALIGSLDNVVKLDRDLGLVLPQNGSPPYAIAMYAMADGDRVAIRETIAHQLKRWVMEKVEPWAERHGMGGLVTRIKLAIDPRLVDLADVPAPFLRSPGSPDYPLIARAIAERLIGEELFEGLGCCELVASPDARTNSIELMTLPVRAGRGDDVYSMVARLTVTTMPYSNDLFLGVSAMKRCWAKRKPVASSRMPQRVTGYVMAEGRPAMMVPVERRDGEWEFGDGYAALQFEAGGGLPKTLQEAIAQREFNHQTGWWAGLPELPTLFKFVSPRTVFESDEVSLLETVVPLLGGIVTPRPVALRPISLGQRPQGKLRQEMLKLADIDFGAAGESLRSEGNFEDLEDDDSEETGESEGDRTKNILYYREQNIRALQLQHGDKSPVLWVLGGTPSEQEIIKNSVKMLFGESVTINLERLPEGTHGLRDTLDGSSLTAQGRFAERVKRWASAAARIKELSGDRPIIALICAADRVGNRAEDPVNYYAGIHAMSKIGANVHHVLPIETPDDAASTQSFLHRTQSALLDVFLAHSGLVFGVKEFANRLLPPEGLPHAIYGIQALRSRARSRSGETGVNFILYTRLVVETGVTEVQFYYRAAGGNKRTEWMPLAQALQWLGGQRQMQGDEPWLKDAFVDATKETLITLGELDPHAVVMIDWSSVAGLWPGIRDVDLQSGCDPKVGNASLKLFPGMSFIRLRRGSDTLSLRTASKSTFEGWVDSEDQVRTGEVWVDSYYTTTKSLVEVSDDFMAGDRAFGHFIATMGYAKTVQVKRGRSCYRPMPRMAKIGKDVKNWFEQKMLDPAALDAALPAPMDITIMSAAAGVQAKNLAMLVMGLRLGYAHYNDWTTLPAPMFFRRKIEDYVIRFPEDEEAGGVTDLAEESSSETGVAGPVTQLARLLVSEASPPPPTAEPVAEETLIELEKVPTTSPQGDDLLSVAKATPMPSFFPRRDSKLRTLHQRMLQQDATVRVRVELPYWVRPHGLFGPYTSTVRRNAANCWKGIREFGYVGVKEKMPRDSIFLDWIAARLEIPQAAHALIPICANLAQLDFQPLTRIIEAEYNPDRPPEERINVAHLTAEGLGTVAAWADRCGHDALLGWLIFQVAQFPASGWCEAVLGAMTRIPGQLTEEALKYYLDVAYAVNAAIAQKDQLQKFKPIILRRPKPKTEPPIAPFAVAAIAEPCDPALELSVAERSVLASPSFVEQLDSKGTKAHFSVSVFNSASRQSTDEPVSALTIQAMPTPTSAEEGTIVALKTRLIDLIQQLAPGNDSFGDLMAEISSNLDELSAIHRTELDQHSAIELTRQRLAALRERCDILLAKLSALKDELELGGLSYVEPAAEAIDAAEESLAAVQSTLKDIEALRQHISSIEAMPTAPSLAERQKRLRIINEAYDQMLEYSAELKTLLGNCQCLSVQPHSPPEPPPGGGQDETSVQADLGGAAPVPLATEEATPPASAPQAAIEVETGGSAQAPEVPTTSALMPETNPVVLAEPVSLSAPSAPAASLLEKKSAEVIELPRVIAPEPEVAKPASENEPEPESNGEADDESELVAFSGPVADPELLDREAGVLHQLALRRFYGLASVHVEALRPSFALLGVEGVNSHYIILKALVGSLERMDCQFEFDSKLDPDLKEMLEAHPLSGDALCDASTVALGVLAAGLSSMLFDSSDVQWNIGNAISSRLVGHSALTKLIEHIDTVRQRGLGLTRDLFLSSHVGDQQHLLQEITRFQKRAAEWKNSHEVYTSWNHRGFRALHEEMFSSRCVIGQCLLHIAKGDVAKVKASYDEARRKFEKPAATVDEIYKKIGERTKPDGLYRARATENVEVTRLFVDQYLELVKRRENPNMDLVQGVQKFLSTLHRHLADSVEEISQVALSSELGTLYRDAALTALRCALRLYENTPPAVCVPQDKQRLLLLVPLNRNLMPVLDRIDTATPALCTPADVLAETGRWANEELSVEEYGENIDAALQEAMRRHIAAQRFLPAFRIEALLPRAMSLAGEPLIQIYNKKKASFVADLQEARQKVTHAMTLNALPQNEANTMQRVIEEMLASLRPDRSIGHPDGETATFADFPQASAALRHNVLLPLEARLREARRRLEDDLQEYAEAHGLSVVADVQRVRAMLNSNNAASLRTAHDALAILKQTNKLPAKIGGSKDFAGMYDQFMAEVIRFIGGHKTPLQGLLNLLAKPVSADDPAWLSVLDETQRKEAVELVDAWLKLFHHQPRALADNGCPLETVFTHLGIGQTVYPMLEQGRSNRFRFTLPERAFTFPSLPDDDMFIPPVLGSWATHLQGYVLTGSPHESEVRQLMQEIGSTPTIAMTRMRLNMQKRTRITGQNPVLLIDDDLVAYVALHPNERLQALMRVAVMTFSTNPYDDYGGRPVPSEMFFGRQDELRKLREVKSSAVLYGGRRLGKSSLLSQIERETNQTPSSKAVYVSMETVNSSSNHVAAAWEFIYKSLVSRRIIPPMNGSLNRWQAVSGHIEKELAGHKELKSLYLLIDEADALMGCELKLSKGDIGFVRSLQQMIDNVLHACQVRYVIAGLHNMTRMTTEENSVFGKAEAIALEPFTSPEDIQRGIRLVTKPLAAMGYLFGEGTEDLPLRILSVCNFYPAFIQLYCKRLVDRLQNNRQDAKPPLYITAADLDAVENDSTLLAELRRKFELNLNLDKRYKAIALLLADVYYSEIEKGHYNGLTTAEIRDNCEEFVPNHFHSTGPGVYEALLEEMKKLNVLERVGTRYVLRNPNIAMMIGDRDRVINQLVELAKEPPEESRNHGERRIFMDMGGSRNLFPFPVAWVRRYMDTNSDGELLIVTGNDLSGISDLLKQPGREEWRIGQEGVFSMLPGSGPISANEYVSKGRRPALENRVSRFVAVRPNSWSIQQIPDFAAVATKAAKVGIRFLLLAMPERAYELALAMDSKQLPRGDGEGNWRMVPVPPWTDDAVFFQLHENIEVSENSKAIAAIGDATCGFTKEILAVCSNNLSVAAALSSPTDRKPFLAPKLDDFYKKVGLPPAFIGERRRAVEGFLRDINGEKRYSIEVEEWRDMMGVTQGEMDFMYWMGLLQDGPGGTWKVPSLYADLIEGGA